MLDNVTANGLPVRLRLRQESHLLAIVGELVPAANKQVENLAPTVRYNALHLPQIN